MSICCTLYLPYLIKVWKCEQYKLGKHVSYKESSKARILRQFLTTTCSYLLLNISCGKQIWIKLCRGSCNKLSMISVLIDKCWYYLCLNLSSWWWWWLSWCWLWWAWSLQQEIKVVRRFTAVVILTTILKKVQLRVAITC